MNHCYPTIYDAGPTLKQHWVNVLCSPGKLNVIESDILRELDFSGIISDFAIRYWNRLILHSSPDTTHTKGNNGNYGIKSAI